MHRFLLLVLLAACGDSYPPPDPLPTEYTTCQEAADCVAVELGCCDACNGGLAVGARADQADTVRDLYSESCGAGTACTEMGCPAWIADCVDGTCAIERGSFTD